MEAIMTTERKTDRMIRVERFKQDLVIVDVQDKTTFALTDVEGIQLYFKLKNVLHDQIAAYEVHTTEILDKIAEGLR
jgi:hypothetical protein